MSNYQLGIENTISAINNRAANYRNMVVSVVIVTLTSVGLYAFSPYKILSVFILFGIPICGFFLYRDHRLVTLWRNPIWEQWKDNQIDINLLKDTLLKLPKLPVETIEGMFSTFRLDFGHFHGNALMPASRQAIVLINELENSESANSMLTRITGVFLILSGLTIGIATGKWIFLSALFLLAFFPLIHKLRMDLKLQSLCSRLSLLTKSGNIKSDSIIDVVTASNITHIKTHHFQRILSVLEDQPRSYQ